MLPPLAVATTIAVFGALKSTPATVTWDPAAPLPQAVPPELFSFTADFHAPETSCHGVPKSEAQCWRNASILDADLSHPRLKRAVELLAPAFWRIGGSPADMTTYGGFGKTECPKSCAALVKEACGAGVFDSEDTCKACIKKHTSVLSAQCGANPGFADICKLSGDDAFYCLMPPRWHEILSFGAAAGAKIVFGLNYASPSVWVGNGSTAKWSSENARELLQYTFDHNLLLYGVELGNELNIKLREPNTTRLGAAFSELSDLVDEIWQDRPAEKVWVPAFAPSPCHLTSHHAPALDWDWMHSISVCVCFSQPVIIGPDVSWVHDQPGDAEGTPTPDHWLKGFLRSFQPRFVTFHQ